jgi:hypothetical protein
MSAVFLAAAVALPAEGEPDVAAMRAFVAAFTGPWPLVQNSYPAGLYGDRIAAMEAPAADSSTIWRVVWGGILDDFAETIQCHDDVAVLRLRGCRYLIVGGHSWGDWPEGYQAVSSVSEWADLCAAGGMPYTWLDEAAPLSEGADSVDPAGKPPGV